MVHIYDFKAFQRSRFDGTETSACESYSQLAEIAITLDLVAIRGMRGNSGRKKDVLNIVSLNTLDD